MKKIIGKEIGALEHLGREYPSDELAQASIAGQVDVLTWLAAVIRWSNMNPSIAATLNKTWSPEAREAAAEAKRAEAKLSPKSQKVLDSLKRASEGSNNDGWKDVYLDNADHGLSGRALSGHLSALEAAGHYRPVDGYAFGEVWVGKGARS